MNDEQSSIHSDDGERKGDEMQPDAQTQRAHIYGSVFTITDGVQSPVEGVKLTLHSETPGRADQQTFSTSSGAYDFVADFGQYSIEPEASIHRGEKDYDLPADRLPITVGVKTSHFDVEPIVYEEREVEPEMGNLLITVSCAMAGGNLRLEDVNVHLNGPDHDEDHATDSDGEVALEVEAGEYTFTFEEKLTVGDSSATLDGPLSVTADVVAGEETKVRANYRLVEEPEDEEGHIVGQVLRREGSKNYPLEGVTVSLTSATGRILTTLSRVDGWYEFVAPEGDYTVDAPAEFLDGKDKLVRPAGSAPKSIHVTDGISDTPVPAILYEKTIAPKAKFGILHVSTAVDESALTQASLSSSVPLAFAGFHVTIRTGSFGRTYKTNATGQVDITLQEGIYDVEFDSTGPLGTYAKVPQLITSRIVTVEVKANGKATAEALYAAENGGEEEPAPSSLIRGQVIFLPSVRDELSKAISLEGVEVTLHDVEEDGTVSGGFVSAVTDSKGIFTFSDDIEPGRYEVHLDEEFDPSAIKAINIPSLRLADRRLQAIEVSIDFHGDEAFVGPVLYVPRSAGIEGIITPRIEGMPVALINVVTQQRLTTATDPQGYYHFDQPEPGTYALRLESLIANQGLRLKSPPVGSFSAGPGKLIQRNFEYLKVGGQVHGYIFLNRDGSGIRNAVNSPISNVEVELSDEAGKTVKVETTGPNGEYFFTNVEPGKYLLEFKRLVEDTLNRFDEKFELESPAAQPIDVVLNESTEAKPVSYTLEQHQVIGRVLFRNSKRPIPGVTVVLFNENNVEIARGRTGPDGRYRFQNVRGRVKVKLPEHPSGSPLISANTIEGLVNSTFDTGDQYYDDDTTTGAPSAFPGFANMVGPPSPPFGGTVQDAIQDIASYMPTSQEVGHGGGGTSQAWLAPAGGDLQGLVNTALVHVLGRKGDVSDGRAFLGSLERAFTIKTSNGTQTIEWTPRTYAVETELGGKISGAQASLYHLAKSALDDALPLLDGVRPLLPDYDPELTEAARKIVRTEFSELVEALGVEGGPILQRVDDLFAAVDRALLRMRDEFGLFNDRVNTVEEESNLTNFLVVRDYVTSLKTTWLTQRGNISGFLGTKLVLLSKALSSVVESVTETEEAMDAVYLGPAERQTVRINLPAQITLDGVLQPIFRDDNGNALIAPPMLVGELLGWIRRFAMHEGPALIVDGGRIGVSSIQPTADRLRRLVVGAIESPVPHVGFTRNRVRRSLSELATQLAYVAVLATELNDSAAQRRLTGRI